MSYGMLSKKTLSGWKATKQTRIAFLRARLAGGEATGWETGRCRWRGSMDKDGLAILMGVEDGGLRRMVPVCDWVPGFLRRG